MNFIIYSAYSYQLRYLSFVFLLNITSCTTGVNYLPDQLHLSDAAVNSRLGLLKKEPTLNEMAVPFQWWLLFNDDTLLKLESMSSENLDIKTAVLRIEESRAQLGIADAARRPNLAMESSLSRSALSKNSSLYMLGAPSTSANTWSLGLEANWEIDLWGYRRHISDAEQARFDATYFGQGAAKVSVAAEIARIYLLLRGSQAQIKITQDNKEIAENILHLAESRERYGAVSRVDSASARAELAGIEARLTQLRRQRSDNANALALLLALPPHELDKELGNADLPSMPSTLPIGISSELARNRPDILQAEARLRATVSDIGAAKADFYPRIRLDASLGMQAFELYDLGSWASRDFSVGPTIHLPIFEGGRLRSQLALSETRQQLAAIEYQKTVLRAWHEVDDALREYSSEHERYERLQDALKQNEIELVVARQGYKEGTKDLTAVLLARRSLLTSQSALADCATASALSVVSLYRALGGGWSSDLLSDKKERSK